MDDVIRTLENITYQRNNRALTFGIAHVFKAMQLMYSQKYVSRSTFCQELNLGEGSVKTLISHLKKSKYSNSIRAGTYLLKHGVEFINNISKIMISEIQFEEDVLIHSQYVHMILLKNISGKKINEEAHRYLAMKNGATTSSIVFFKNNKIITHQQESSFLSRKMRRLIIKNLKPQETDLIVMSSAFNKTTAEMATKMSALCAIDESAVTVMNYGTYY